jgi:hypothetical protein
MDRSENLHAIREALWSCDLTTDKESVTMSRLHEHQFKRGVAREERFAGSERRIVNEHRTGVVSCFMLGVY